MGTLPTHTRQSCAHQILSGRPPIKFQFHITFPTSPSSRLAIPPHLAKSRLVPPTQPLVLGLLTAQVPIHFAALKYNHSLPSPLLPAQ